jgi:3-hydroxyisobutyrate dehydrogenase
MRQRPACRIGGRAKAVTMSTQKNYEPITAERVAFLGLGVMGYPMAGHLARAGHHVTVYNRTAKKAERWVEEFGGGLAATPRAAVRDAKFVFCCVGNDADLRSVTLGESGALAGMAPESVFIDHTTASAEVARDLYVAARAINAHFIDAPVSGGQAGAVNGTLTVMCGGDAEPFERMRPVAMAMARAVTRIGPSGAGQLTKMVNQITIAGLLQGLAEGLAFGRNAGLEMKLVLEVIGKGAAQSWQMDNRGPTMLDDHFDFGFAVDWMRKDLGLCLDEAARNGSALPVTALVNQFYADVQAQGGARWDTSSLIRRLPRRPD